MPGGVSTSHSTLVKMSTLCFASFCSLQKRLYFKFINKQGFEEERWNTKSQLNDALKRQGITDIKVGNRGAETFLMAQEVVEVINQHHHNSKRCELWIGELLRDRASLATDQWDSKDEKFRRKAGHGGVAYPEQDEVAARQQLPSIQHLTTDTLYRVADRVWQKKASVGQIQLTYQEYIDMEQEAMHDLALAKIAASSNPHQAPKFQTPLVLDERMISRIGMFFRPEEVEDAARESRSRERGIPISPYLLDKMCLYLRDKSRTRPGESRAEPREGTELYERRQVESNERDQRIYEHTRREQERRARERNRDRERRESSGRRDREPSERRYRDAPSTAPEREGRSDSRHRRPASRERGRPRDDAKKDEYPKVPHGKKANSGRTKLKHLGHKPSGPDTDTESDHAESVPLWERVGKRYMDKQKAEQRERERREREAEKYQQEIKTAEANRPRARPSATATRARENEDPQDTREQGIWENYYTEIKTRGGTEPDPDRTTRKVVFGSPCNVEGKPSPTGVKRTLAQSKDQPTKNQRTESSSSSNLLATLELVEGKEGDPVQPRQNLVSSSTATAGEETQRRLGKSCHLPLPESCQDQNVRPPAWMKSYKQKS